MPSRRKKSSRPSTARPRVTGRAVDFSESLYEWLLWLVEEDEAEQREATRRRAELLEAERGKEKRAEEKRQRKADRAETKRKRRRRERRLEISTGSVERASWFNERMSRWIHYVGLKANLDYEDQDEERLVQLAHDVFEIARAAHPRGELWSGGYTARVSTRDFSSGAPAWEDELHRQAAPFRRDSQRAERELKSKLKLFASGGGTPDAAQHFYRLWIQMVHVHVADSNGGRNRVRARAPLPPRQSELERVRAMSVAEFGRAATAHAKATKGSWRHITNGKLFISEVHAEWIPAMPLDEFKRRLGEANRQRAVRLSRADLIESMDPLTVKASHLEFAGADYHFIQVGD